ncbi:MAG: hypothetical protein WAM02_05685 [Candidatus Cybelea sp.]
MPPQLYARSAGLLYLIEIALAFAVNLVWSNVFDAGGVAAAAVCGIAPGAPIGGRDPPQPASIAAVAQPLST